MTREKKQEDAEERTKRSACAKKGSSNDRLRGHESGPRVFTGLVVFLLISFPVAFSLAPAAVLRWIGIEMGVPGMQTDTTLPLRIFRIMANDAAGDPFFTFMGDPRALGHGRGSAGRIGQLFVIRGNLACAVILVVPCWPPPPAWSPPR
jgi:TRAP-type mannitol/chloroaromatic compound transport system permease large subunit